MLLKEKRVVNSGNVDFYIPEVWNTLNFTEYKTNLCRKNEININPYDYYTYYIEYILNKFKNNSKNESGNLLSEKSIIYCLQPRMLTAWNHVTEDIEYGSFIKSIALLPYLKEMNINTIYLLPLFENGKYCHKGNAGSCYSIKNIYKLDENLHDKLLGECTDELLNLQFGAFVEACHILNINVMVDFAFRTVSRDSDLIIDHPDWFYWIKKKSSENFRPLYVESLGELTFVTKATMGYIDYIYASKNLNTYLDSFTYSPDILDKKQWKTLVDKHKTGSKDDLLNDIEDCFGVTTAPGFADVINDYQDPWEDVTYLRLSFDTHERAKHFIRDNQPPYVLQDIAMANLFCGKDINYDLWTYIENVIPYYQEEYGIDGARIDMGHALPDELNSRIINKARSINPNFIFWSEDFFIESSKASMENGFNFITGNLWQSYREHEQKDFWPDLTKSIFLKSELPIISSLETPDTLRVHSVYSDMDELSFLMTMSFFAPNTIPLINNGMEIGEREPMNVALDKVDDIKDILEKQDPMNGLMSFFDNYRLHWCVEPEKTIRKLISTLSAIRIKAMDLVTCKDNFTDLSSEKDNLIIWMYKKNNKSMLIISYIGTEECVKINLKDIAEIEIDRNYKLFNIDENADIKLIESNSDIYLHKYKVIFGMMS
jgi:glycosidase